MPRFKVFISSVEVMLFKDSLEVSNPGRLAPELCLAKLRTQHGSYPTNPQLAECMYQPGILSVLVHLHWISSGCQNKPTWTNLSSTLTRVLI
jgi:hypothetical protein